MYQFGDQNIPQSVQRRLNRKKKKKVLRFLGRTLAVQLITTGVLLISASPAHKIYASVRLSDKASSTLVQENTNKSNIEPILIEEAILNKQPGSDQSPQKVIIPKISLDVDLRPSKVINGQWEVFEDSGSFGLGSALPGGFGNSVIFAHARRGLFLPLKDTQIDDIIYILNDSQWFSYKIVEIKEVMPSDISVIKDTPDETLTLFTCSGFADSKRLIVVAKRI